MFDFLNKLKSAAEKPSRSALQAELGKNEAFGSLTEQTKKDVLDMLAKVSEVNLFDGLHQLRAMTAATRDKVVAKFLQPEGEAPQAAAETYTVKAGDSLSKIAKAHNKPLNAILAANPQIKSPDLIHPQQVINLG